MVHTGSMHGYLNIFIPHQFLLRKASLSWHAFVVISKSLTRITREQCERLFHSVDIHIDGVRPWDLKIHDDRFFSRSFLGGSLGFGEAYMDGWWDSLDLEETMLRIIRGRLETHTPRSLRMIIASCKSALFNAQTRYGSKQVAQEHYDLGNEVYMSFLDPYNQYTCGFFEGTDDLNIAQENKLELICRKLHLKKSDRVLDIGCGWGGFCKYAASHIGCHVTGITISKEQRHFAEEYCKGLPVDIVESDYRDHSGIYDKILVCGMIEHVGYKNYRTLMNAVKRCLKDEGLFLLHTIGSLCSVRSVDPWISKYIFPNSMLPSASQISHACDDLFVIEDWHNFGSYYAKTLRCWHKNFIQNWDKISSSYDERFRRMFEYYFLSCAAAFRARNLQLWQIVLSPQGVPGGYAPIRTLVKESVLA
jgi:cyclopropane-fatty-acyl-phospholipid synthase